MGWATCWSVGKLGRARLHVRVGGMLTSAVMGWGLTMYYVNANVNRPRMHDRAPLRPPLCFCCRSTKSAVPMPALNFMSARGK